MKSLFILLCILCSLGLSAQVGNQTTYDLTKNKVLYTVGYAHLDSEWNWDYTATINEYIKNIMTENFHLFEKYPDYTFNFTGSRRYGMMKEYYPQLYSRVKDYIHQGRWFVSGSSVDEGEVNMSSSESIIRQVLYGNNYFRKEFGVESKDYMLPDCFGFVANMPSIWNHCGLLGFSTQKLTWRSAVGVPFNVGVWNGPDGKGIIAALNATDYGGNIVPRLDLDDKWSKRLDENMRKYGISFDYRYYGVGDQGGAPRENDVKNVMGSLHKSDSKFKVLLTSSDQMYKDITQDVRQKLPTYSGDLLLIEHSAGSLTSQAYMKRLNRKNEILAQASEQLATFADWAGKVNYPFTKLNHSWELVLGSQFHDILPGTSIPKAYEYAWNDEFVAANGFASVLRSSVTNLSEMLNTQGKGRSVVVYNPVATERQDVVSATLYYNKLPANVQVFNSKGEPVPTQVQVTEGNNVKVLFLAKVPSVGLSVFDIREIDGKSGVKSDLSVTENSLENNDYKVTLGKNGDIISIFDKQINKELLASPSQLAFMHEAPNQWPSWNMDWKDRKKSPVGYMDQLVSMRVVEQGPVRVAIEVKRKGMNSTITQVISLAAGAAGKHVEIYNQVDWQSHGVSLKASFPLSLSNPKATYNLGVGTIQRGNNDSVKFEVPSKKWFDLSDKDGNYGVTILEDCKYGSDKPSDNTLRLTLLYTPETKWEWCRHQGSQDWGVHEFRYGIYGHKGTWQQEESALQGELFNQPMLAFETPAHTGKWGKDISFLSSKNPEVGVMAIKKMEQGNYFLVRVNELSGKDLDKATLCLPGKIIDAYEVNGQEKRIGNAEFEGNNLHFGLTHYTIRSFAVKLAPLAFPINKMEQKELVLPFNLDVASFDDNRDDGNFSEGESLPAELVTDTIESDGVRFKIESRTDGDNNALFCKGQEITLPAGDYTGLYLLAAASGDTQGDFKVDDQVFPLKVQSWKGFVGQFYNRSFARDGYTVTNIASPFSKQDNIAWFASHFHNGYPSANMTYQYCYLYKYDISLPKGATKLTLPFNNKIKVLAITLTKGNDREVKSLQPLYDDFHLNQPVSLVNQSVKQ